VTVPGPKLVLVTKSSIPLSAATAGLFNYISCSPAQRGSFSPEVRGRGGEEKPCFQRSFKAIINAYLTIDE